MRRHVRSETRYGFSPSRIHANRGDRLRLTFSTRDTGQSFFFQDYDLHVSITPGNKLVSVRRLSRPDDPPVFMETVEMVAGLPGWPGWPVSKSQSRNHTYNGPLHGTERGELIVAPNFLPWGGLGLLVAIPFAGLILPRRKGSRSGPRVNLFTPFPWLKRVVKSPSFQFNLALPMLGVFWFIILAPIGFPSTDPPRIGSLQIVDLDKDGLPDILVVDMLANRIGWTTSGNGPIPRASSGSRTTAK